MLYKMKKIIFGFVTIFIASQLLVSCSSESTVLSQFSKRKYLKKYKKEKVEDEHIINEYEYTASSNLKLSASEVILKEMSEVDNSEVVMSTELVAKEVNGVKLNNVLTKDYSEWKSYNRKMDFSSLNSNEREGISKHQKITNTKTNDVLLIILSIFIPPLAVFLYDNSLTTNFWVDLLLTFLFWFPGMIFAFLVCFGGVSL